MPSSFDRQAEDRFVEFSFTLKVPQSKLPRLTEALASALALSSPPPPEAPRPAAAAAAAPAKKRGPAPKAAVAPRGKSIARKTAVRREAAAKPVAAAPKRSLAVPASKTNQTLRFLREKEGLSQKALADKLGLRQTDISALETGKRDLTEALVSRVAQVFNLPVEELLALI